jgi:hypothetical protein
VRSSEKKAAGCIIIPIILSKSDWFRISYYNQLIQINAILKVN